MSDAYALPAGRGLHQSRRTAGNTAGLIFSAAAKDPNLHAFDVDAGKEVWIAELPASAQSTPMMYEWRGKQYTAICGGGDGKMKSKGEAGLPLDENCSQLLLLFT